MDWGETLPCPFQHIFHVLHNFSAYTTNHTPDAVKPKSLSTTASSDTHVTPQLQHHDGNPSKKKKLMSNTAIDPTHSHQIPEPLYKLRVQAFKHAPDVPLGHVLCEGGKNIGILV